MSKTMPPRLMAVHDISGFGRTSLTVVIPIISAMGIQVCPLPTAVLSTHTTEFTDFTFCDLTEELPKILDHWKALNLKFEGVYSGFLANHTQVDIVERAIEEFLKPNGVAIVDPVMGDNGKLDPTITPDLVKAMQRLITKADYITPNYSESCFLLEEEVKERSIEEVKILAKRLADMGPKVVVITSVPTENEKEITVIAYEKENNIFHQIARPYVPVFYPGTGDTFASVFTASILNGCSVFYAIENAVKFVGSAIETTFASKSIEREGIFFEKLLSVKK